MEINIKHLDVSVCMSRELKIAKVVALKAGKLIMEFYDNKNYTVKDKGGFPEDYFTEADTAAEKLIFSEIKKEFPNHGFIGEESFDNKKVDKEFVWIIDPIDGTREFVNGTGEFAVHIGLAKNGKPVLGVVYVPVKNKLYYAEKGKGAFLNDKKIYVSIRKTMEELIPISGTRSIKNKESRSLFEKTTMPKEYLGGTGNKICAIAEKVYDFTMFRKQRRSEWDLCAPEIILEEAGGKITDFDGNKLEYNRGRDDYDKGILVSNGPYHKQLLEQLNS